MAMSFENWIYIVINLFIGWLLGLLAPAIVQRIKRDYRVSELETAINKEIHELKCTMAIYACTLKAYSNELTDEFIVWLKDILAKYEGHERDELNENVGKLLNGIEQIGQLERSKRFYPDGQEGLGIALVQQALPLLDSHIDEIATMPIAYQERVLRIKKRIYLYNERVSFLQKKLDATFNVSGNDHNKIIIELKRGYKDLGNACRKIADIC